MTDGLLAAARHERDWRAERYPARIAARESDPEAAAVDYQCWCSIAEWLETERFGGFYGGADAEGENAPWITWPELEVAAESALAGVTAKLDAMERQAATVGVGGPSSKSIAPETLGALRQRRSWLCVIARRVQLRRHSIDAINAELRTKHSQPEGISA